MALPWMVLQRFPMCLGACTLMYIDGVDSSLAAWMTSLMSSPILSDRIMHVHTHTHWPERLLSIPPPHSLPVAVFMSSPGLPSISVKHWPHYCAPYMHFTNQSADGIGLLDIYCFYWLDSDQMLYLCSSCCLQMLWMFCFYLVVIL